VGKSEEEVLQAATTDASSMKVFHSVAALKNLQRKGTLYTFVVYFYPHLCYCAKFIPFRWNLRV